MQAGLAWLDVNHRAIDDLNVFPVPDGDSGTNMLLTLQAACAEIARTPSMAAGNVMRAVAHGALMGARGNSGVITSQIFRGMADGLGGKTRFNGLDLAHALTVGAKTAYGAVAKPVEGTILTVAVLGGIGALRVRHSGDAERQNARGNGLARTVCA